MAIRTRTRYPGVIDAVGQTVPFPLVPMWVPGRFYDSFALGGALTTLTLSTNAFLEPFLVPKMMNIVSLGVEVSGAAGAGSLLRYALYDDDHDGLPYTRLLDAGTVASDATGFRSITINRVLRAGIYWFAISNKTVTTGPTVRASPANSSPWFYQPTTLMVPNTVPAFEITITGDLATGGFVDSGWPYTFPSNHDNVNLTGGATGPRLMMEV